MKALAKKIYDESTHRT